MSVTTELNRALALMQGGELEGAERACRNILRTQATNADALHLLGVLALQKGQLESGAELIRRSLLFRPKQPHALCNLGNALRDLKQPEEALSHYREAVELAPDFAGAFYAQGNVLGDLERPLEAVASYDRALALEPDYAEAHLNRGNALRKLGRDLEALESYRDALRRNAALGAALNNCARLLLDLGRASEALPLYEQLLAFDADDVDALIGRAATLLELGEPGRGVDDCSRALRLEPGTLAALFYRGEGHRAMRLDSEALADYRLALRLKPGSADLHYRCGIALRSLNRHPEAAAEFAAVLALAPGYDYAVGNLLHEKLQSCDWNDYENLVQQVDAGLQQSRRVYLPGPFLSVSDSAADQLRCAQLFVADKFARVAQTVPVHRPHAAHATIRIGYVSADLRDHPVSQLLAGVFEQHDRSRFEVIAVSLQPPQASPLGARVVAGVDRFVDVSGCSDSAVAKAVADLEIDIAVDLMGFSGGSRPAIFAHRAAPVQVNFLGYSGSLGAPWMDYIIADSIVIPPLDRSWYSEKVAYLPHCFQPNDAKRAIAAPPSREALGLPASGFVFCCFNNHYKISPRVFAVWMRLLHDVADSVLWLAEGSEGVMANLRGIAQQHGVSAERLIFAPRLPALEDHLARYQCADLFLDTLPYNAHTTASDALWAGLPLLTCRGNTFAARVATSLLRSLELPELVVTSLTDYEARARELATERESLGLLRERLLRVRTTAPLFDTRDYCRLFESALAEMWRRHTGGVGPAHFAINSRGGVESEPVEDAPVARLIHGHIA